MRFRVVADQESVLVIGRATEAIAKEKIARQLAAAIGANGQDVTVHEISAYRGDGAYVFITLRCPEVGL